VGACAILLLEADAIRPDCGTAQIHVPAVSGPDWRQLKDKQDEVEPRSQSLGAQWRVLADGGRRSSCAATTACVISVETLRRSTACRYVDCCGNLAVEEQVWQALET